MYQNASNKLGSDENLRIEILWDKILEILFISYVKRKLRVWVIIKKRFWICLMIEQYKE